MPTAAAVGVAGGVVVVVLAIVGIVQTRRRSRRGRGLAIAAIPLGLIGGVLQGPMTFAGYQFLLTSKHAELAATVLATSTEELPTNAAKFYDEYGSARFKASIAVEDLEAWLAKSIADRGQLQDLDRSPQFIQLSGSAVRFRFQGRFVSGSVPIEVEVGFDADGPRVDDIRVDGSSPLR